MVAAVLAHVLAEHPALAPQLEGVGSVGGAALPAPSESGPPVGPFLLSHALPDWPRRGFVSAAAAREHSEDAGRGAEAGARWPWGERVVRCEGPADRTNGFFVAVFDRYHAGGKTSGDVEAAAAKLRKKKKAKRERQRANKRARVAAATSASTDALDQTSPGPERKDRQPTSASAL
eukprot:SAG11_NODE_3887_length_2165_cov_1.650048_1_plen_176_part_00